MDDRHALVVFDYANLQRFGVTGGPMNIVTAWSSVSKARQ
jgi:hypothetical protein